MRYIVRQAVGDTMLLDTVAGHAVTFAKVEAFLSSPEEVVELAAKMPCPLFPDDACIAVLRLRKTGGLLRTRKMGDEVLEVTGRPDLLALWAENLLFAADDEQGHHHPDQHVACLGLDQRDGPIIGVEPGSERVIIEAYILEDEA